MVAEIIHDHDESSGASAVLMVFLAVIVVAALLFGGWWLFVRQPVQTAPGDTEINIEQNIEETTSTP